MRGAVFPVMGVLAVVAGAVGLQLGESAIAQIDPIHFMGAPGQPRDVTQDRRPQRTNAFADAFGWEEGYAARTLDCGDCSALNLREGHVASAAAASAMFEPRPEPRWEYANADDAMVAEAERTARAAEPRSYQRYLHYPVSAEQAERAALAAEAEPLPPEPQAGDPVGL